MEVKKEENSTNESEQDSEQSSKERQLGRIAASGEVNQEKEGAPEVVIEGEDWKRYRTPDGTEYEVYEDIAGMPFYVG